MNLKQVNEQAYDHASRDHGQRVARRVILSRGHGYTRRNQRFLAYLGVRPGMRVIEFGCGMGHLTLALAELGCEVVATDVSGGELELVQANARWFDLADRITVAQGEPATLPAAWQGSFDFAVTSSVLHHVEDPHAFVKGMASFVQSGGYCGGLEPNAASPLMRAIQEAGFWLPGYVLGSREAERLFPTSTAPNIQAYATAASLQSIDVTDLEILPRPLISRLPLLTRLDDLLVGSQALAFLRTTLFWKGIAP